MAGGATIKTAEKILKMCNYERIKELLRAFELNVCHTLRLANRIIIIISNKLCRKGQFPARSKMKHEKEL